MKTLLALLLLSATTCSAVEIVATGYGKTQQEALDNAKVAAVDRANGLWLNGQQNVRDSKYSEKITTYSGGVIRTYEVIDQTNERVTIKADVVPREKNGMGTNSVSVPPEVRRELGGRIDNQKRLKNAVQSMDDLSKALNVVVRNVQYNNVGANTAVTASVEIGYNQKWIADLQELTKEVGVKQQYYRDDPQFAQGVFLSVVGHFSGIAAGAGSVVVAGTKDQTQARTTDYPAVCVDKECYVMGEWLSKFYKPLRMTVTGLADNKTVTTSTIRFNDEMDLFEIVPAGSQKNGFMNRKYTYENPTLVINKDKVVKMDLTFVVESSKLASVDKFNFNF
jgi:hypothetical protein